MPERNTERQNMALSVEILDPHYKGKPGLITKNISQTGVFVLANTADCLPVGRVVTLRLPGTLWGEKVSTVSARVVRVTDEGMGIQFLDFDIM